MSSPREQQASNVISHPAILLTVLCAATFMSSLDVFIVNVALRTIGEALQEDSLANLSWLLNAYAIVFAALLIPAGRLADRYGAKPTFLLGLALFTLGSLGSALSGDLWILVGLRCLQAVGAAALVPTSLSLVLGTMPPEKLNRSIQLWAISGSLGAAAGPAIGGVLVQASWRWIFVINVPIGIAAFLVATVIVPRSRPSAETGIPDLIGGILLVAGTGALTLGLVKGPDWGWASDRTIGSFVLAVIATALFLARSGRASAPVLDLTLFRDRTFAWANASSLIFSIAFGIQLLGLVLWLQEGWNWSAVRTGIGIAPGPIMVSVTALGLRRWTSLLSDGTKIVIGTLLLGGGGLLIGSTISVHEHYFREILPGWMIMGAGVGLAVPTLVRVATSTLPERQASTGSAVVQMGRQLGSVIGVAILVIVIGSSNVTADAIHRFSHAWWWAAGAAIVAAITAAPLMSRATPIAATAETSASIVEL